MNIINLLPEHLEMLSNNPLSKIDILKVSNVYNVYPDIYLHLKNEILKNKELCVAAIEEIGTEELISHIELFDKRFERKLSTVLEKMRSFVDLSQINSDICITVGNNSTNAIVTWHNTSTLFLFAEKIEIDYLEILLSHEITHLLQRKTYSHVEEILLIDLLFSEGVACYFSKVINQGYSDLEYINFKKGNNNDIYLQFIEVNLLEIGNDLNRNASDVYVKYLSSSIADVNWIPRIGYHIGFKVIERIAKTIPIDKIIALDLLDSRSKFKDTFELLFNINKINVR